MRKFTYQTNLYKYSKYDFKLEQWRVEVKSIERRVKRLKSEDIFLCFYILKGKMNDERKKMCTEMK